MYLIPNEGKSIVAERFIRTLKTKIYKYMISISKNVYIDKLDDILGDKFWIFIINLFFKINICIIFNINRFHLDFSMIYRKIKMKPVDVKNNTYIDFKKAVNHKYPKFKVGDHVRISKYKTSFAKGYTPNWSEEVFFISKIKNNVPRTYVINDLNCEEIIGTFYEKKLQKTNQKEFEI